MKNEYDVIVVGGGPGGSMAAWEVAKKGISVCLLEKDKSIGPPVRCGEATSEKGLRRFLEIKEDWISERITGAQLGSPSGKLVDIDFENETGNGYILNRKIFDYDLSQFALKEGSEIYTNAYVKNIKKDNSDFIVGVFVDYLGEEKFIKSKILIAADGCSSRIGRWAGIRTQVKMKDMESAVQYYVSNINLEPGKMIMYVGSDIAPGGYLWIFPKGKNYANIGIGISGKYSRQKSAKKYLDEFIKNDFPNINILSMTCGGVPCGKPMRNPVQDGLMLVGDAAHQINPMTGGGILSAMTAGYLSGQVAIEALALNDFSKEQLNNYSDRMWKEFGKNYERFYKIRCAIDNLTDKDIDGIAEKVLSIPHHKRKLSSVFKAAIFKKPSLIIDVIKVFSNV